MDGAKSEVRSMWIASAAVTAGLISHGCLVLGFRVFPYSQLRTSKDRVQGWVKGLGSGVQTAGFRAGGLGCRG